jgi:hypothetical protein
MREFANWKRPWVDEVEAAFSILDKIGEREASGSFEWFFLLEDDIVIVTYVNENSFIIHAANRSSIVGLGCFEVLEKLAESFPELMIRLAEPMERADEQ